MILVLIWMWSLFAVLLILSGLISGNSGTGDIVFNKLTSVIVAVAISMTQVAEVAQWTLVLTISFVAYLLGTLFSLRIELFSSFAIYWRFLEANTMILLIVVLSLICALGFSAYKCIPISASSILLVSIMMAYKVIEFYYERNQNQLLRYLDEKPPLEPIRRLLATHLLLGLSICVLTIVVAFIVRMLLRIGDGRSDPLARCLKALPVLFCIVVPSYAAVIAFLGRGWLPVMPNGLLMEATIAAVAFVTTAICVYLLCRLLFINRTKQLVFARYPQEMLEYAVRASDDVRSAELGVANDAAAARTKGLINSEETLSRARAEESFTWLLLCVLGLISLLQGITDSCLLRCLLRCIDSAQLLPHAVLGIHTAMGLGVLLLSGRMTEGLSFVKSIRSSFAASIEIGIALPFLVATVLDKPVGSVMARVMAMILTSWILGKEVDWRRLFQSVFLMLLVTITTPFVVTLVTICFQLLGFFSPTPTGEAVVSQSIAPPQDPSIVPLPPLE